MPAPLEIPSRCDWCSAHSRGPFSRTFGGGIKMRPSEIRLGCISAVHAIGRNSIHIAARKVFCGSSKINSRSLLWRENELGSAVHGSRQKNGSLVDFDQMATNR